MEKKSSFLRGLIASLVLQLRKLFTVDMLINFLKEKTIKLALQKLLLVGGFQAFIVTYIIKEFYKEIGGPIIQAGLIELDYIKDEIEGDITAEKIVKARRFQNAEDYHNSVSDIFN